MSEMYITPAGHIRCRRDATATDVVGGQVAEAFDKEGAGGALFRLGAIKSSQGLNPAMAFWKDFASRYLSALCHTPESAEKIEPVEPPAPAEMLQILLSVPPMTGAEYLTVRALDEAWQSLDDWTHERIEEGGGLAPFLKTYAPHWHQVGRVCFHLAENKSDPEYPFAFMATYASGLSKAGKLRYLPLSKALVEYAGARNKNALVRLLTPVSEAAKKSALVTALLESGDIYHPYPLEPDEAHCFLTEVPLYEEAGLLVRIPDWWRKRPRLQARVSIGQESSGKLGASSLLDFQINAAVGGQMVGRKELEKLLAGGSGLRFVKGQWVEVDADKLKQVLAHWENVEAQAGEGVSLVEGMRLLAGAGLHLQEQEEDEAVRAWSTVTAGSALGEWLRQIREPETLKGVRPGKALHATLRPYQETGLNWLWLLSGMGLGACLADDMGLGKTIQVIALLLMQKRSSNGTSLLIVPASLLGNWRSEIEKFAPSLRCAFLHRSSMSKQEMDGFKNATDEKLEAFDVVFTTYAMATRLAWLQARKWNLCVLDEAQAIKNANTRQTKSIKKIPARSCIALTGTPVENRLGDLWSLFDFINPGLLGSAGVFKNFIKNLESRAHDAYHPLRNLVRPYILRRLKTDRSIIKDLPDKVEVKAYCHLSAKQAALYQQSVEELAMLLETSSGMARRGLVLSFLMRFKQICNHPSQLSGDSLFHHAESGKFDRLRELTEEIASRQDKVLIFTQFREMTAPLADFLSDIFGRPGLVLHGGTPVKKRKAMVDQFQDEDGPPFFILSLKAGGTGLNLTAASHVIHFDRWWNPAVENQATDRAFRIGQKKNVLVHKFICRGTLEERIDELMDEKSRLVGEVLESGAEKNLTEMSDQELLKLVAINIEKTKG